ncbi:MAG: hypothetical protein U0667_09975 [Chloroflexota bacterium]
MDGRPPAQRTLRAGPMTVVLEAGALRWLRMDGVEVIRGVYVAVRDERWGTVAGALEDVEIRERHDSFDVRFRSRHHRDEIDFSWHGRVSGNPDGSIEFGMDGVAGSRFRRNRIGICLLHPMEIAGSPMRVTHPTGIDAGSLPDLVEPWSPFLDITGMRWPVTADVEAVVGLEGDLFEMEDQRNWTDASFKTFSTPLRLPTPVTIEPGTQIRQRLTLRLDRVTTSQPRRSHRVPAVDSTGGDPATIQVHPEVAASMPRLGTTLAPGRERLSPPELGALQALRPAVLRTVLELDRASWPAALAAAQETASAVGAPLEVEAVAGDDGAGLDALMAAIEGWPAHVERIYPFPTSSHATTGAVASRLRGMMTEGGPWPSVGGGSRANLAELNRADLPFPMLDAIAFPMCPQVHTFDDASVMENIAAQAVAIRTAQARSDLPLTVGPITLRPRFDAYGLTRPIYGPANEQARMDLRLRTQFGAAWTIGSLAAVAPTGVRCVLLHEATGPAGLIGPGDEPADLPVYAATHAAMAVGGVDVYRTTAPPGLAALAFRLDDGDRVLVANLRPGPRAIEVRLPRDASSVTARAVGEDDVEHPRLRRSVRCQIGGYGVVIVDSRRAVPLDA